MTHTTTYVDEVKYCDICPEWNKQKAAVDGLTKMRYWAYMCHMHFDELGVGLGMGRGQRLLVGDPDDYTKTAEREDEIARTHFNLFLGH